LSIEAATVDATDGVAVSLKFGASSGTYWFVVYAGETEPTTVPTVTTIADGSITETGDVKAVAPSTGITFSSATVTLDKNTTTYGAKLSPLTTGKFWIYVLAQDGESPPVQSALVKSAIPKTASPTLPTATVTRTSATEGTVSISVPATNTLTGGVKYKFGASAEVATTNITTALTDQSAQVTSGSLQTITGKVTLTADAGVVSFVIGSGGNSDIFSATVLAYSGPTFPADNVIRLQSGTVIGEIVAIPKTVTYEPGTSKLTIDKPTYRITVNSSVATTSSIRLQSITYTPVGGGQPSTYTFASGALSDSGVRWRDIDPAVAAEVTAGKKPERSLVAGSYTVTVCVASTDETKWPGAGGCSLPIDFVVNPKVITPAMLTVEITSAEQVYSGTSKSPRITVKDGSQFLIRGYTGVDNPDYTIDPETDVTQNIDVGTYDIAVIGANNYRGRAVKTYTITKAELAFEQFPVAYKFSKRYDGSNAVSDEDSTAFVAEFMGYPVGAEALGQDDYVIKAGTLKYSNKDVGRNKVVTATIDLSTDTLSPAKNYKLKSNAFSWNGGEITKGEVTLEQLKVTFDNPAREFKADEDNITLYNKAAKEVKVAWASGVSNSGSKFTVKYDGETAKKTAEGTYAVTVDITEGSNLLGATELQLGSLTIAAANRPIIDETSPADTSYYALGSVTLRVNAKNPKDDKATGLSYQWYQLSDTGLVAIKGKTANSLVVNDTVVGARSYAVRVTYKGSEQDTASAMSRTAVVTTLPRPLSLKGAVISCSQEFIYDGSAKSVTAADLTVTVGGEPVASEYYEIVKPIRNNINAGEAIVTIKGVGAYKDTETGSFTISKKTLELSDLQILYQVDYNGTTQEIRVAPVAGKSGIGEVTRIYDSDSARLNAGSWNVELSIGEGTNYEANESITLNQPYVIRKTLIDESMLVYTGVPKEVLWDGQDHGIAKPTLKGVGTFYSGDLEVVYVPSNDPSAELTEARDSTTYTVRVKIAGDRNFAPYVLDLGIIDIRGLSVSVAEGSREIPAAKAGEAVSIAPVKVAAGEVTVGPNPVGSGSSLAIYWSGSRSVSGKLSVYTALGKKVAVVPVSGSKKIGLWNTSGAPEGTYLIKGVLTAKDGSRVKVSNLVSVTR